MNCVLLSMNTLRYVNVFHEYTCIGMVMLDFDD